MNLYCPIMFVLTAVFIEVKLSLSQRRLKMRIAVGAMGGDNASKMASQAKCGAVSALGKGTRKERI